MNRTPQIFAILSVAGLTLLGYVLWGRGDENTQPDLALTPNADSSAQTAATDNNLANALQLETAPDPASSAQTLLTYTDPQYGFRFEHATDFHITSFTESGGAMVLAEGNSPERIFQIFIQPVNTTGNIVPADIERELPNKTVDDPTSIILSGDTPALMFRSQEDGQSTREVWLLHNKQLFQVRAPISFDAELSRIMSTWTFE
jgi:hypothetical protein